MVREREGVSAISDVEMSSTGMNPWLVCSTDSFSVKKKEKKGKRKKVKDVILDMNPGRGYVPLSLSPSLPLALQWINRIRRTMDDAPWTLSVEP